MLYNQKPNPKSNFISTHTVVLTLSYLVIKIKYYFKVNQAQNVDIYKRAPLIIRYFTGKYSTVVGLY